MTIAYNYNVVVRRIVADSEPMFEARVKEFPDLTEYAATPQEAYELAIDAINTVVEVFTEKGRRLPLHGVVRIELLSGLQRPEKALIKPQAARIGHHHMKQREQQAAPYHAPLPVGAR